MIERITSYFKGEKINVWVFGIILFLSLLYATVAGGWAASPNVYYFIGFCTFLPCTFFLKVNIDKAIKVTSIDGLALLLVCWLLLRQGQLEYFIHDYLLMLLVMVTVYAWLRRYPIKSPKCLAQLIIFAVLFELSVALYQLMYTSKGYEVKGTFLNSGVHAIFVTLAIPAILYLIKYTKGSNGLLRRLLLFIFLAAIIILTIVLGSRTAWLMQGTFFVTVLLRKLSRNKRLYLNLAITLGVMLLVAWGISSFYKVDSSKGRTLIWKVSCKMIQDHPIFGFGLGQFSNQYPNYQAAFFKENPSKIAIYGQQADISFYAFNEYIQLATETGIMGIILFFLLVIHVFVVAHSGPSDIKQLCADTLLLILVASLFYYPLHITPILLIFVLCIATISNNQHHFISILRLNRLLPLTLSFLVTIAAATYCFQQFMLHRKWAHAATIILEDEERSLRIYKEIFPKLSFKGTFLYNYGAELYETGRYNEAASVLVAAKKYFSHINLYLYLGKAYENLGQYDEAIQTFKYVTYMVPNRFYPNYFLAKSQYKKGDYIQAKICAVNTLKMPVKVASNDIIAIQEEMRSMVKEIDENAIKISNKLKVVE